MHPRQSQGNRRLTNTQRGTTPAVQPTLNLSLNRVELYTSTVLFPKHIRVSFLRSLGHITALHHSLTRLAWVLQRRTYSTYQRRQSTKHATPAALPSPHLTSLSWPSPSSNARQNPLLPLPRVFPFLPCTANKPRKSKIP